MEDHFVHTVSRFLPPPFTSCQFRSVPDVVESSINPITKTTKILHDSNGGPEPFSNMNKNPFLSKTQEPKMPKNDNKVLKNFKKKILLGSDNEGSRCPPVTPISVLASEQRVKPKESKINNSSSSNSGWFSSDDEEGDVDGESDTCFSLSSCSSESFRLKTANTSRTFGNKSTELIGRCSSGISAKSTNTILSQCSLETTKTSTKNPPGKHRSLPRKQTQFVTESGMLKGCEVVESSTELYYGNCKSTHCRKTAKSRPKTGKNRRSRRNVLPGSHGDYGSAIVDERLEESYAVEKSSNDPHGDFRTSMVEMIIEKQIFGAKDLERLLYCFLSLNSPYYHRIIIEVFTEICDTLFSN